MRNINPNKLFVEYDDYYLEDCQRIKNICEEQGWYITLTEAKILWSKASHIEGRGFCWHHLPEKNDYIEEDADGSQWIFAQIEPLLIKSENK